MDLASSGLITGANPKALELLGYGDNEIKGKPFSLFVERDDLVVFFSHWNELRSSSKPQSFEAALKHKQGHSVYLNLEFGPGDHSKGDGSEIRVLFNEATESRKVSSQMQFQEDLLNLIFNTTDAISTVSRKHLDRSIEDTLKKLCLVTESDLSFIYRFNRKQKCLEPAYQWDRSTSDQSDPPDLRTIPLEMMKRAIVRLRQDKAYVVNDVAKLPPAERFELLTWHQTQLGAFACHLIYASKRPIGIIGLAKNVTDRKWPSEHIALVKFIGQMLAEKLSFAPMRQHVASSKRNSQAESNVPVKDPQPRKPKVIDIAEKRSEPRGDISQYPKKEDTHRLSADPGMVPDLSRPMTLEKLTNRNLIDQQPVFPRDDGLVLLTCPRCGLQESVSVNQFEKLGNALSVTCSCNKPFAAVLEKRRAFRKTVRLAGHFSLKEDTSSPNVDGAIWGIMVVRDLSKAGLRFSSSKSDLVHPGDLLMVRFHLDNSNRALIHKPARVISVNGEEVGCKFEGDDSYDITLGFYFI